MIVVGLLGFEFCGYASVFGITPPINKFRYILGKFEFLYKKSVFGLIFGPKINLFVYFSFFSLNLAPKIDFWLNFFTKIKNNF